MPKRRGQPGKRPQANAVSLHGAVFAEALWHWVGVGHGAAAGKTEPLVPRDCHGGVQGLQFTGEKAVVFGLFWKGRISGEGHREPSVLQEHGLMGSRVCKSGSCPF